MTRRPLIPAALALLLGAGMVANTDTARAAGRGEGRDRHRHEDRQRSSEERRSHAGRSHGDGDSADARTAYRSHDRAWRESSHGDDRGGRSAYYDRSRVGGYGGRHGYDDHSGRSHGGYGYRADTYGTGYGRGVGYAPTYGYTYGGAYYTTSDYGANLLRSAVNYGYQQGRSLAYQARAANWGYDSYRTCDPYRAASYGYQAGYIDPVQYSYYYRVGFERGYREAFYAAAPVYAAPPVYSAPPAYYGVYRPGPVDLVVGVLDVILNLQHLDHHGHHSHR